MIGLNKYKKPLREKKSLPVLFSTDQIKNISSLGDVLRQIRARLEKDGISIDNERKRLLLIDNKR